MPVYLTVCIYLTLALQAIHNSKYSVPYVSTLLRTAAAPLSIDETEKQSHHNSASYCTPLPSQA